MRISLQKINTISFLFVFGTVFVYIIFKVLNVPITHDEVATTVHYNNFNVWEIMMYPDPIPNNHILNTLSTKFCIFLFGSESWSVRLPNLLSFLIYAFGAYRILKIILPKDSMFYIPAALLFISSPYLLDFFGLCRGYGISTALCTLSMSYMISGFANSNSKNIWAGFVLSILACYANFTLMVFWMVITIMTWFYFYFSFRIKKTQIFKPTLILIGVNLAYAALIAVPIYKMQSTDQFQFWTSKGFIEETIKPLISHSKYDSRIFITTNFLAWFSITWLVINSIYVFFKLKKTKSKFEIITRPISIATIIILITAGINILEVWILDLPNLNGRTALFFYPLFIIALISSYDILQEWKLKGVKIGISILMTTMIAHHVIHTMKPYSVREWSYDANTLDVLNILERVKGDGEITLATNWMFYPSFYFYSYTGKFPSFDLQPSNHEIDVNSDAQYYYIFPEDYPMLELRYEVVRKFENNCWLLKAR